MDKLNSTQMTAPEFMSNLEVFHDETLDIKELFAPEGCDPVFCEIRHDVQIDGLNFQGGDFVIMERKTGRLRAYLKPVIRALHS